MESKTHRTTSDVIVIYEANDTEGGGERRDDEREAARRAVLVNPKKHDMGGEGDDHVHASAATAKLQTLSILCHNK